MKDYSEIMNLPREDREKAFKKDRERILASGTTAKTVLLYLDEYFKESRSAYFRAFEELPLDSELKNFQVVKQGLNALNNLETQLQSEIKAAERVAVPEREEDDNLNI